MGTEYYLVREDNNTLFELGKGLVNDAFSHLEEAAPLPATIPLTEAIFQATLDQGTAGLATNNAMSRAYAMFVAKAACAWADGAPVWFCSEHQIEDDRRNLKVTGSRYYAEVSE